MTSEMYNNDFHLVHSFCVIFLAWPQHSWWTRPRVTWPRLHALMATLTSLLVTGKTACMVVS